MSKAFKSSISAAAVVLLGGVALLAAQAAHSQPAPAAAPPAAAAAPAAGDAEKGSTAFKQRCAACHSAGPYNGDPTGPDLNGVIGRKAGSLPDFDYSPALAAYGQVWTPALMDQYLAGPKVLVPGTKMASSVADPQMRADVIAFLASNK